MTDFERITNPVVYLFFFNAFDLIDLRNAETTSVSFSKVHFKSQDTSRCNHSYLKHSIIIGRKNGKWIFLKNYCNSFGLL